MRNLCIAEHFDAEARDCYWNRVHITCMQQHNQDPIGLKLMRFSGIQLASAKSVPKSPDATVLRIASNGIVRYDDMHTYDMNFDENLSTIV